MASEEIDATATEGPGHPRARSARVWLACAVILNCLYVGSIGPVCCLTGFQMNGHLNRKMFSSRSQRVCEVIYWPICRACEQSGLVTNSVSRYIGFSYSVISACRSWLPR